MRVNELFSKLDNVQFNGNTELLTLDIEDLSYNTSTARHNVIFFALRGRTTKGSQFINVAYEKGVRVFVVDEMYQDNPKILEDSLIILVNDVRKVLSFLSNIFFGEPSKKIKVVGVTGTKGKTTTTTMLYQIFKNLGINAGVIGTNGIFYHNEYIPTNNTTPESYEIHKALHKMFNENVQVCFIEVSSQGMMMNRVDDICFELGVVTNIAVDHIGELEHPTFENYLSWKLYICRLSKTILINNDDEYCNLFKEKAKQYITYSLKNKAMYKAEENSYQFDSQFMGMKFTYNKQTILLSLIGEFNIYNALIVLAVANHFKLNESDVIKQLSKVSVSGRMEIIPNKRNVLSILDYAHNGFSLEQVLKTVQNFRYNRLFVLFGSVGDRTKGRRKELGDVVSRYSDVAIITSDNPGFENPMNIINEIAESFVEKPVIVIKESDRQVAIQETIKLLKDNDVIIFAGKGHETYQLIEDKKVPFNEKQIIMDAFTKI